MTKKAIKNIKYLQKLYFLGSSYFKVINSQIILIEGNN